MTDEYLTHLRELRPNGSAQLAHLRTIPTVGTPEVSDPDAPRIVKCDECGEVWTDEFTESFTDWSRFHSTCRPAPCRFCGTPTNTPDACFDCYHGPFGIGRGIEEGWL